jgi:hypothetical protein
MIDLDLDFFLSDISYGGGANNRLDESRYTPWSEKEVRAFLERQCGLSKSKPLPGKIVVTHDEVFDHWRDEIEKGQLIPPFEVIHVDAHADLGMGDASYFYLMTEHLGKPVSERSYPPIGDWSGIGEGNYLAFAIACRWISKLTYVHHPKSCDDLMPHYMKDNDENSGFIQLKYYGQVDVDTLQRGSQSPLSLEPEVPFELVPGQLFQNEQPFDRIYLARSPSYTPEAADRLIPIIKKYIVEDPVSKVDRMKDERFS